jgi:predicted  nucleic acid-binding Zn-ribbon protein
MKAAGFEGFERGERGSTAEHLSVVEYKTKQESARLSDLKAQADKERKVVDHLTEATKVRVGIQATQTEIDAMARPSKSGNNKIVANADWEIVSDMAKRCALLDAKLNDLQAQIKSLTRDRDKWKTNYERLWSEVKDFIGVIRKFPERLRDFIRENFKQKSHSQEVSH